MELNDRTEFKLKSGKSFYSEYGIIGLSDKLDIVTSFTGPDPNHIDHKNLSGDDINEICDYMISKWKESVN